MTIIIDCREKLPYRFANSETAMLETGDYTVAGFEDRFAVERKTLDDLARSVGTDRKRFEAEIKRAESFENFVVVIEAGRADAQNGSYRSAIHPKALLGTIEKWPMFYNVEFQWCGDREQGQAETHRLLTMWTFLAASGGSSRS